MKYVHANRPMPSRYVSGLDLGQASDFTALVVCEQTAARDERDRPTLLYAVRHIERFALGTPYPQIVTSLKTLFAGKPLAGSALLVDRTGVGRPVYDMLTASGITAATSAWSITAGRKCGIGTVPKCDLVAAVQATLSTRRLQIAPSLPLASQLAKELEAFRVKVTDSRNETFSSWRERDHDDLVLALALAVWAGERLGPPGGSIAPGLYTSGGPADGRTLTAQPGQVAAIGRRNITTHHGGR